MKHLFTLLILMYPITPEIKGQSIAYHRHRDAACWVTSLTAWSLDSSAAQLLVLNMPATNTRSINAFRSTAARFPIRIYYNNGVGPQQVDTSRATP